MEQTIKKETFESRELYKKAISKIKLESFDEAAMLINEALKIYPDNPHYMSAMGLCVSMQGNLFAGENMCRRALELAKEKDPLLFVNIGRVLLKSGKREEARKYFLVAYKSDNTNTPAALELSRMGVRRKPILSFFDRDHPLNIKLGKLRHTIRRNRANRSKKV